MSANKNIDIPCRTGCPGHCCRVCPMEETSTWCPSHWAQPAEYLQPHLTWLVDPPKQNTLTLKNDIQINRITITEDVVFGWVGFTKNKQPGLFSCSIMSLICINIRGVCKPQLCCIAGNKSQVFILKYCILNWYNCSVNLNFSIL